jgi:hypothetical protein
MFLLLSFLVSAITPSHPSPHLTSLSFFILLLPPLFSLFHHSHPFSLLPSHPPLTLPSPSLRNRLGASDVCPQISKCLTTFLESKKTCLNIVKSLGNLSANNPNNQTKLGGSGACELLVEILKNIMPSDDIKSLLSSIKIDKSISKNFTVLENSMNKENKRDTDLENGNLAKWVFWTIGNMVEIGNYYCSFPYVIFCYFFV